MLSEKNFECSMMKRSKPWRVFFILDLEHNGNTHYVFLRALLSGKYDFQIVVARVFDNHQLDDLTFPAQYNQKKEGSPLSSNRVDSRVRERAKVTGLGQVGDYIWFDLALSKTRAPKHIFALDADTSHHHNTLIHSFCRFGFRLNHYLPFGLEVSSFHSQLPVSPTQ